MNIYLDIEKLLTYAQAHLLLDDLDVIYARNLILDELKLADYVQYETDADEIDALQSPEALVNALVAYAVENGTCLVKNKARLGGAIMGHITKRPSEVIDLFFDLKSQNEKKAIAWLEDYFIKSAGQNEFEIKTECGLPVKAKKSKEGEAAGAEVPGVEYMLAYATAHLLLDELDVPYVRRRILDALKITDYSPAAIDLDAVEELSVPTLVLDMTLNYALEAAVIKEADKAVFTDKLMSFLLKRPSEIVDMFETLKATAAQRAFEWLYDYAVKSNYVNLTAVSKNRQWEAKGTKGRLEITINLSRPEKSDKEVEKAANEKGQRYPLCPLCKENEGLTAKGVSRKSLRTVPLTLGGEEYFWQYSPYSYFNQHGIAIKNEHTPMMIDQNAFVKLLDFVDMMPAYFLGSNATLPRVGGSVLSHDHFQGGKPVMPMFKAPVLRKLKSAEFPYIKIEQLDWYCPVIRIQYTNKEKLAEFAELFLKKWENYSDKSVGLIAKTGDIRHNAIAPIARKFSDGNFCLDLILRNNAVSEEFPDGIFAAHPEHRFVKSEAVGLTEAMGWFILPGRLNDQLARIEKFLTKETRFHAGKVDEDLKPFIPMIEKLLKEAGSGKLSAKEAELNVKDEINRTCENILTDIAVFQKNDDGTAALNRFYSTVGLE